MKTFWMLAAVLLATSAQAKVRVVASVSDLGAIAREIGGDAVSVELLSRPTQDPHFVDAKPSLAIALNRADLLLVNGMDLEVGWLATLMTASRNGKIAKGSPGYLDCSTFVKPLEIPTQKLDRSMGDVHPGGNPHYLKSPRNGLEVAKGIAQRLAEIDPDHASLYQANAARFVESLSKDIAGWEERLKPYKGTPVVTYHKSWIYFTEWAGFDEVAFVEPKPGLPPSTGHVAAVLNVLRSRKVPLILQEEWYSAATSQLLSQSSGAKLVRVPGMAAEGQRYADSVKGQVEAVLEALKSRS